MPTVDIHVDPIDAPWPPPGGGLVAQDFRQRLMTGGLKAFGRIAPKTLPGVSMMALYLSFMPHAAEGVDAIYLFDLAGPGGGRFSVAVKDGACRITVGEPERAPDVVYEMDASTWASMVKGEVTGDEAVLLGRLRIKGDVDLGRRFEDLFAPVGNSPVRAPSTRAPAIAAPRTGIVDRVLRRRPAA
jgi:hypothetical protein